MIVATHITGKAQGAGSSIVSASISPTANNLILVSVSSRYDLAAVNTPTLSGAGMTWTQVGTVVSGDGFSRLTLFRALSGSPGSGALTADFAGQNQSASNIEIDSFSGVDTSGTNGANAILQAVSSVLDGITSTGLTITLSAFSSTNNAAYGTLGMNQLISITVGSGFTQLGNDASSLLTETEFKNTSDTTVDWTWSSGTPIVTAIALELKMGSTGGFFNFL